MLALEYDNDNNSSSSSSSSRGVEKQQSVAAGISGRGLNPTQVSMKHSNPGAAGSFLADMPTRCPGQSRQATLVSAMKLPDMQQGPAPPQMCAASGQI